MPDILSSLVEVLTCFSNKGLRPAVPYLQQKLHGQKTTTSHISTSPTTYHAFQKEILDGLYPWVVDCSRCGTPPYLNKNNGR